MTPVIQVRPSALGHVYTGMLEDALVVCAEDRREEFLEAPVRVRHQLVETRRSAVDIGRVPLPGEGLSKR